MAELIALRSRRGQLKAKLTRFQTHVAGINKDSNINQTELKVRREKVEEVWQEFDQVQNEIEENGGEEEDNVAYRIEFEEAYFKAVSACEDLIIFANSNEENKTEKQNIMEVRVERSPEKIGCISVPSGTNGSGGSCCNSVAPIQLAALSVPIFSGLYNEWPAFYDIFGALVHNNTRLDDIQRFFHLRASLSGEAAQIIQCYETTANNYKIAWETLISRYNNRKVLVQTHVRELFDLPAITEQATQLRRLIDKINGHINALKALGENPQGWGALLIHLITCKLDANTVKAWETVAPKDEISSIQVLIQFLEKRFKIVEAVEAVSKNVLPEILAPTNNKKLNKNRSNNQSYSFAVAEGGKCFHCKLTHNIYKCPSFLALPIQNRIERANVLKLCKICLRPHSDKKCFGKKCFKCHKSHNTLLHLSFNDDSKKKQINEDTMTSGNESEINNTAVVAHAGKAGGGGNEKFVLLSTAVVKVLNKTGEALLCRVLLDSGSQKNFISESMVQTLQLNRKKIKCDISGIGQSVYTVSSAVTVTIRSRTSNYSASVMCLILPKVTNSLPAQDIDPSYVNIPNNIQLADSTYNRRQKVDMLLGAELFFDLLNAGQIKVSNDGPIIQETKLGWVVAGPVSKTNFSAIEITDINLALFASQKDLDNLDEQLAKFWRLENVYHENNYTPEEKLCKEYFNRTVRRNKEGRFIVKLPFRSDIPIIGNSYAIALRRFVSIEKRLNLKPELKAQYVNFMNEYLELNHMEVLKKENDIDEKSGYFLPHHAVINEYSKTTKLRVVFDGSCKTDTGVSLNDIMLKGPTIQEELVIILSRFQKYKYALSADISKTYRQILVDPQHRKYQKIVWRSKPDSEPQIFQLNTVTYGTVAASFLATGCLFKLAEDEYQQFPAACTAIQNDFYMDDYLGGTDTLKEAMELRNSLLTVMNKGGFKLCKWMSNDRRLLYDLPNETNESMIILELENKMAKILGLLWSPERDVFKYKIQTNHNTDEPITKRNILSKITSLFDPLGLVGPIIMRAKILMQRLWQLKLKWDQPVPTEIRKNWENYILELHCLQNLEIPRFVGTEAGCSIEVHGFSDASLSAYGACLYIIVTDKDNKRTSRLICAKSKISPLKIISLPRLELCAAVILSRLMCKIVPKLKLSITKRYFWTDSSIVLAWISSPSAKWKTFVSHRVGEIHDTTSINEWFHVNTKDNPADLISRGCSSQQLIENNLWWYGPSWLLESWKKWPKSKCNVNALSIPEARENVSYFVEDKDEQLLNKYSSWNKLLRIVVYCLRFIKVKVKKEKIICGFMQPDELREAEETVIRISQTAYWSSDINSLIKNSIVSSHSKLKNLQLYLENGIIRVGGRLKNAMHLEYNHRHPILIPAESAIAKLILQHYHEKLQHAGPQAMLAHSRLKYWILNGRNIARNIFHKCVKCFRLRPVIVQPIMGNLPSERISPTRPFLKCGVDYAGPINIKTSTRKKAAVTKGYICVFVCFSTRAVHIELVSDLTTESFLNALKRFIARRGVCTDIYSDNATNFVGANKKLQDLKILFHSEEHKEKLYTALSHEGIKWHFIPPRSPHFGGLWEASIKSIKTHLYRVLGLSYLTYDELNTILIRIESVLNSRPLSTISSDPTDTTPLTPGHFLIGEPLCALPEPDLSSIPDNRLKRWQRVSKLTQLVWRRWHQEYLSQLQTRKKWLSSKGDRLRIGTLVLIKDDNIPPFSWAMGRISHIRTGGDGECRVATVLVNGKEVQRTVRKLCPLPFDGNL